MYSFAINRCALSETRGQLCEVSVSRGRNCNGDISAHIAVHPQWTRTFQSERPILEVSLHYVACIQTRAHAGQWSLSDDLAPWRETTLNRNSSSFVHSREKEKKRVGGRKKSCRFEYETTWMGKDILCAFMFFLYAEFIGIIFQTRYCLFFFIQICTFKWYE